MGRSFVMKAHNEYILEIRTQIIDFLKVDMTLKSGYSIHDSKDMEKYLQQSISFKGSEEDIIKAYLLIPKGDGPHPAVLIHHQHNGERHLGKSEVLGLVGDPLQAFGPALARKGFIVLTYDSICFESRRKNTFLYDTVEEESDWIQHYNEMSYRILKGDTLMRKILEDASIALSILENHPMTDKNRMGLLGHSYGGNTVLFQGAIDKRVQFACVSGALCSYKNKFIRHTGMEMALVIPGFVQRFDFDDILMGFENRKLLVVSADNDKYSEDAGEIVELVINKLKKLNIVSQIEHQHYLDGHALTKERFDLIIDWLQQIFKSC